MQEPITRSYTPAPVKYCIIAIVLFFFRISVIAQPTMQQQIEDSVIGWKTVYTFKGKQYKPLVVEGQTFSSYQQSLRDSFITWMQRTYAPIGGFGDIFPKNFTSVQHNYPVPQSIGMAALIYGLFKSNRTGKYEMAPNEDHNDVLMYTNALAGINNAELLSSPDGYYFTMWKDNYTSTFTNPTIIEAVKDYGLHNGGRFSKYLVYFMANNWVTVVLTPGNKLPITQLTKGEVLMLCEKGLQREMEARKKEARQMSSNNPSYYAGVIKDLDEKLYPQCIKNLNQLKEKYKNKLNEQAILYGWAGPSFAEFTSTSSIPTLFVEDWYQQIPGYPVYRYTKEAMENSKKDKPLWVAITWQAQKPNSRVKPYELHLAMLRYFNYDYVYDYFFNPEKVKGQSYLASNATEQATRIQTIKKHGVVAETKSLPKGVFFADDFSANTDGSRPAGWNDSRSRATASVVTLKNQQGKWLQLGLRNNLSAGTILKKPLPENFSLEFDVVTDPFNVRTGGAVTLSLSTYQLTTEGSVKPNEKGTTLQIRIIAGNEADYNNNNYSGGATTSINSTIGGYEGDFNTTYDLREFTNKKTMIHAALKVKNGTVTLFINDKQVAASKDFKQEYNNTAACKGLPPSTLFQNLLFTNMTQNWSPDGKSNAVNIYISNITITYL